jgi:peptide-methionine (R)-S-oxide reductase
MAYKVERTEEEWRRLLDRETYRALRENGTERPWSGDYVENLDPGVYLCKGCDAPLFQSDTKFVAQCGWPAFSYPVEPAVVETVADRTQGMFRTRVRCSTCGSHLGYLFHDGPEEMGGYRYCINSIALRLQMVEAESNASVVSLPAS